MGKIIMDRLEPVPDGPGRDEVRVAAGLLPEEAAHAIGLGHKSRWSEYKHGKRGPDETRWNLFLLRVGRHPAYKLVARRPGEPLPRAADPLPETRGRPPKEAAPAVPKRRGRPPKALVAEVRMEPPKAALAARKAAANAARKGDAGAASGPQASRKARRGAKP